ncbi:hypothetical protein [Aliarcobacter cryaerophilus]|uniref:hypothetical protein n=1 Tax=Aliarcobacter cryaerophilus TaxID=28198 RepID=UPI003DA58F33
MDDKKIFFDISILSLYIFLKEKYKNHFINQKNKNDDIKEVSILLLKNQKYIYIKNKQFIINDAYEKLLSCYDNSILDEEKLFSFLDIQNLNENEKKDILNGIFFVANRDNKISNIEKELIVQIDHSFNLNRNYNEILNEFNKSEYKESFSTKKLLLYLSIFFVFALTVFLYFLLIKKEEEIKIFDNKRVVFNELSFNRYSIYKNQFNDKNSYYLKQAVFYISGRSEIAFNPENIKYDSKNSEIILYKNKLTDKYFDIYLDYNPILLVDKIDPQPLKEELKGEITAFITVAGVVGGTIAGKKIGMLTGALPESILGGAALGGIAGYGISKALLSDDFKLSKDISKKEEDIAISESKNAIKELLLSDKNLENVYKKEFEEYIKSKYLSYGISINKIKYEEK